MSIQNLQTIVQLRLKAAETTIYTVPMNGQLRVSKGQIVACNVSAGGTALTLYKKPSGAGAGTTGNMLVNGEAIAVNKNSAAVADIDLTLGGDEILSGKCPVDDDITLTLFGILDTL